MSVVKVGLGDLKDRSVENGPNPIPLFFTIRGVMVFGCVQGQVLHAISSIPATWLKLQTVQPRR